MSAVSLTIDGRDVSVPPGRTILEAARRLDIKIPTLCHLDGYERTTSCMVCVVQDMSTGRLVPACSMPASDGLTIQTDNAFVRDARKDALDFLLSEHVGDCEAPCRRACPAQMDIPLMNRQIEDGRYGDALITVKLDIALPAVLGRICPAPCEKACHRTGMDGAVSVCRLKRFVADVDLASAAPHRPESGAASGKKVAVVGAGPAGLSAACYLARDGHECHVYDQNPLPGGMLRYGVPDDRLDKAVLDDEIERIAELGVRFHSGRALGRDLSWPDLRNSFDALVLAMGTFDPRVLADSGIKLSGRSVLIDRRTFETSVSGVFAGGNMAGESRMAIRAAAHGKRIAASVGRSLGAAGLTLPPGRFYSTIGKIRAGESEEFLREAGSWGPIAPSAGHAAGYLADEAGKEAGRCLQCACRKSDSCRLRRYAEEYGGRQSRYAAGERKPFQKILQHDLVVFEPGKCLKCGLCVQITRRAGERFGLTFVRRGFDLGVETPFHEPLERAMEKTAEDCISACPTAALSAKRRLGK